MDWHKIAQNKSLKYVIAGTGIAGICGVFAILARPIYHEFKSSFAFQEFKQFGIVETYRRHYHHFFKEVDRFAVADQREENLVRELASARRDLEIERARNAEHEIEKETRMVAQKLKNQAGSPLARIPEGIEYEIPKNMLPHQLLVLGMEYFRTKQFEKSAVIFHELVSMKDDQSFQHAEYYLIGGISWYKIQYYDQASKLLKQAEKTGKAGSPLSRQSLVWQAIVEKAKGDGKSSQRTLGKLIAAHPQSEEVRWINGSRKPAHAAKASARNKHHVKQSVKQHGESSHE